LRLCEEGRLDELDGEADFEVPFDVAVEEPDAGVVHYDSVVERQLLIRKKKPGKWGTHRNVAEPPLSIWMVSRRSGLVWFAMVMTEGSSEV
jgi:hypothetical protein